MKNKDQNQEQEDNIVCVHVIDPDILTKIMASLDELKKQQNDIAEKLNSMTNNQNEMAKKIDIMENRIKENISNIDDKNQIDKTDSKDEVCKKLNYNFSHGVSDFVTPDLLKRLHDFMIHIKYESYLNFRNYKIVNGKYEYSYFVSDSLDKYSSDDDKTHNENIKDLSEDLKDVISFFKFYVGEKDEYDFRSVKNGDIVKQQSYINLCNFMSVYLSFISYAYRFIISTISITVPIYPYSSSGKHTDLIFSIDYKIKSEKYTFNMYDIIYRPTESRLNNYSIDNILDTITINNTCGSDDFIIIYVKEQIDEAHQIDKTIFKDENSLKVCYDFSRGVSSFVTDELLKKLHDFMKKINYDDYRDFCNHKILYGKYENPLISDDNIEIRNKNIKDLSEDLRCVISFFNFHVSERNKHRNEYDYRCFKNGDFEKSQSYKNLCKFMSVYLSYLSYQHRYTIHEIYITIPIRTYSLSTNGEHNGQHADLIFEIRFTVDLEAEEKYKWFNLYKIAYNPIGYPWTYKLLWCTSINDIENKTNALVKVYVKSQRIKIE